MTIEITHKKLILTAGIVLLIAIVAAGITFMPEKSAPVPAAKALRQKKNADPAALKATARPSRAGLGKTKGAGTVVPPDVIDDEESSNERSPEKTAHREDAYINDTPEKVTLRASLEKEIKVLSEEKDKEVKEMSVMMKSFDDAFNNSQLPPDELRTKQAEIEVLKQTLMSTYNDKISSIDSSLRNKVQHYRDVTTENSESEVEH